MTDLGLRRRESSESESGIGSWRSVGMGFFSVAILIFWLLSMPFLGECIMSFTLFCGV